MLTAKWAVKLCGVRSGQNWHFTKTGSITGTCSLQIPGPVLAGM